MPRRFSVEQLVAGTLTLDAAQSRHVRDVLRMGVGDEIELFDPVGNHAVGRITSLEPRVQLAVYEIFAPIARPVRLFVAAAVPKGNRADWMVEKLSELDAYALIPLRSARSVVHPESGKLERWARLASESAKQCRRRDVMEIRQLQSVAAICRESGNYASRWCLSTEGDAMPAIAAGRGAAGDVLAVIGPEGGWSAEELAIFADSRFHRVSLTQTILRIETAALAIASIVMSWANAKEQNP